MLKLAPVAHLCNGNACFGDKGRMFCQGRTMSSIWGGCNGVAQWGVPKPPGKKFVVLTALSLLTDHFYSQSHPLTPKPNLILGRGKKGVDDHFQIILGDQKHFLSFAFEGVSVT